MVKEIKSFRVHSRRQDRETGRLPDQGGHVRSCRRWRWPAAPARTPICGAAYIIRGDKKLPIDLRKPHPGRRPQQERQAVRARGHDRRPGDLARAATRRRCRTVGSTFSARWRSPASTRSSRTCRSLHALFLAGGVAEGGDLAAAFVIRGNGEDPGGPLEADPEGRSSRRT